MEMEKLAELFEAVKVLPLRPTDIVVLRTAMAMSDETRVRIKKIVGEALGTDRILVLSEGIDIEIVRPEQEVSQAEIADLIRRVQGRCA